MTTFLIGQTGIDTHESACLKLTETVIRSMNIVASWKPHGRISEVGCGFEPSSGFLEVINVTSSFPYLRFASVRWGAEDGGGGGATSAAPDQVYGKTLLSLNVGHDSIMLSDYNQIDPQYVSRVVRAGQPRYQDPGLLLSFLVCSTEPPYPRCDTTNALHERFPKYIGIVIQLSPIKLLSSIYDPNYPLRAFAKGFRH
jgi:hypothetical protein